MARFPQTEPEIAALALVVTQGLRAAAEDFLAPPVPTMALVTQGARFVLARGPLVYSEVFRDKPSCN